MKYYDDTEGSSTACPSRTITDSSISADLLRVCAAAVSVCSAKGQVQHKVKRNVSGGRDSEMLASSISPAPDPESLTKNLTDVLLKEAKEKAANREAIASLRR